ncbi:MAG: OmpA family protein [Hydrogenophilales bacterium]|nr:OmpA family protein [Hydrogenophilales bacterium]
MRIQTLPVLIVLAFTALQAQAADDRLYVAPSVNYTFSDSDRRADDGWGGGVALGKPVTEHLNLELALTGSSLDFKTGSGSYDLWGLGVDALYLLNRDAGFTPYGVLGIGALYTDIPGRNDTGLMGNVGLGIMKRLTDNISLRADARYRMDGNASNAFNANHFGDAIVSVGLNIALGQKAQPAPKPEPTAQPAPMPEPAPAPVAQPEPAVPALTTPQAKQLEQAKSGDTVVILEGVNFEFDSARLRPDAITILDEAVTVLNRRKDISVDVVGHTDSTGTKQYNQGLSERRAKSVYDYFVNKGIAADRLTAKGYGETRPAYSNATREGRAKNRRVELVVK